MAKSKLSIQITPKKRCLLLTYFLVKSGLTRNKIIHRNIFKRLFNYKLVKDGEV